MERFLGTKCSLMYFCKDELLDWGIQKKWYLLLEGYLE